MDKNADPTNPILLETIESLESSNSDFWKKTAKNLGKVNRKRPEVNISDLERNTEEGDTVVVPGKVLGAGRLTKEIKVAAFQASKTAKDHIEQNGEFLFIQDLFDENPEAEDLKIVK